MLAKELFFGDFFVTEISVLRGQGPDKITFTLGGAPTAFPELDQGEPGLYDPSFKLEVRRGYAEEWLRKAYGISPADPDVKLIDVTR